MKRSASKWPGCCKAEASSVAARSGRDGGAERRVLRLASPELKGTEQGDRPPGDHERHRAARAGEGELPARARGDRHETQGQVPAAASHRHEHIAWCTY